MVSKETIREDALARRRAISADDAALWSDTIRERVFGLTEFVSAKEVVTYVSKGEEVDTLRLIVQLLGKERRLLVPIADKDGHLTWSELKSLDHLEPGAFGVPEPRANRRRLVAPAPHAVALVPCVAFAASRHRMGYGKGYFDRFLARHHGPSIGLAYEMQRVDEIPVEDHDIPLDIIVTDSGTYE